MRHVRLLFLMVVWLAVVVQIVIVHVMCDFICTGEHVLEVDEMLSFVVVIEADVERLQRLSVVGGRF